MSRRIALVLLALALVASVATAASSPATSKGKKGKGGSSSSCPNASCGLAAAASVAALQLYNMEVFDVFTSTITLGSGEGCSTTDGDDDDDDEDAWNAECEEQTAFAPRTLSVTEACPLEGTAAGQITQFWCEAYVTDGAGSIISGLPVYSSGTFGDQAVCTVDTSGLADGTTVSINTAITCSNYVAIAPGAKTSGKPKLSDLIKKN